ncbi:MAG TPA: glutathione S-transferase N-terminal domain-containing protein [Alphaproteobacteria bacterium]
MKLFYSPASPFVRKVTVMAHETGLFDRIEPVPTTVAPVQPNLELARQNPLMKLPTLVTDDGDVLYESSLICQYLDSLHAGRKLVPASGPARWTVLRLEALGDGITDAGILLRYEELYRKPEERSQAWIDGQLAKLRNGLDTLEANIEWLSGDINLGQIAVACAIGWLEFRKPAGDIRKGRPRLFGWYDAFVQRPSMVTTQPQA